MKTLTFLLFSLFNFLVAQAQDVIFKTSGEQVNAKVTEVRPTDILYQLPDSLAAPRLLPKTEVFMIQYANGTTELIQVTTPASAPNASEKSPEELFRQGRYDARMHYKGRGVFWGSAAAGATALFTGGITLTAPLVMAITPPRTGTLGVPDPQLAQNRDYLQGYRKQAHRRKVGKAAAGTGTGILAGMALVVAAVMVVFL